MTRGDAPGVRSSSMTGRSALAVVGNGGDEHDAVGVAHVDEVHVHLVAGDAAGRRRRDTRTLRARS